MNDLLQRKRALQDVTAADEGRLGTPNGTLSNWEKTGGGSFGTYLKRNVNKRDRPKLTDVIRTCHLRDERKDPKVEPGYIYRPTHKTIAHLEHRPLQDQPEVFEHGHGPPIRARRGISFHAPKSRIDLPRQKGECRCQYRKISGRGPRTVCLRIEGNRR